MSIVDLPVPQGGRSESLGRTPPQDVVAEQSALGGMMLSKDAIADVIEVLRHTDFYRPAHELIYNAVLDLYGRGEPADAVTVADELTKRGELSRVGGLAYLHTLISSVPTAANAGFYARIVRERAVLRRLVEAGTRIVQLGYSGSDGRGGGDVDELVNSAQAEVYAVTERRASEDYLPLAEVIEGTIDEIEASSHRGDGLTGVPTGFADLDQLTNGLHPGQMIVIAARPAMGKALALDTPLATPTGWTTMGQVSVGDQLIGGDGRPTRVLAATAVMHGRPCYQVTFSDGSAIIADAQHQWLTETRASRRSAHQAAWSHHHYRPQKALTAVRTTRQIAAALHCARADRRLASVRNAEPLQLPERALLVPAYPLGAWLADGASASAKHVPQEYLRACEAQRRDLLAGLLDTGGTIAATGAVQLSVTSERLARDVEELILSLGHSVSVTRTVVPGQSRASSLAFTLSFTTDDDVFQLERKRLLHKELRGRTFQRHGSRLITAVRPIDSVPVRCVQVDSPDHLFLAGRNMVPTHNSTLGLDIARSASIHHKMASVLFSLEMGRNEITMRLLSAEARIPLQHMRKGTMREEDWTRLARTMGEVSEAPFFIDDSPNMSLMEIRAKCRRLKQRNNLKLVIIDYLQLMSSGKRVESRQQEVSEFSRALKLLAKELQVPVVALSQLNRGPEQRTDKKPQMSDLRESGCLTADTRVLRADTGAEVTLGELHSSGARDVPVWSLDSSLRYVRRHLTHVFSTGRKPVFRVRLASGKEVRATANHPFLTYDGWLPIGQLLPGTRVAVPRHVMAPELIAERTDAQVTLLAHVIGDEARCTSVRLPALPAPVFALPKRQVSLFLRHLWATGGSVTLTNGGPGGRIHYTCTSRLLVDGVSRLLLRFGIACSIRTDRRPGYPEGFTLDISGADSQRRFLNEIGVHGARGRQAARLLAALTSVSSNPAVDTVPPEVWSRVRRILADEETAHHEFATAVGSAVCGSPMGQRSPGRPRLSEVAEVLRGAGLAMDAVNDVFWDSVLSIEPDGEEEVFDATVVGQHNFVANGIAVHNSIEQDADMVILLHREDAYEKESPRAGEADFIVAKHRNGPTDTITVAFQGHYSRFVDMAT